jgi:hypothetical protein
MLLSGSQAAYRWRKRGELYMHFQVGVTAASMEAIHRGNTPNDAWKAAFTDQRHHRGGII